MKFLQIIGAALLGLYLALTPVIQPLFVVHRSTCVCHSPLQLLKARATAVFARLTSYREEEQ